MELKHVHENIEALENIKKGDEYSESAFLNEQGEYVEIKTPIATSSDVGGVIIPVSSAVKIDVSGNIDVKLGEGLNKNVNNEIEADIELVVEEI